ncbi:MAG TPA: phosphotransferase [Streptosporangiaceae bacterium]|nr:phosphotransferase [Streptosporangiaceae bacterium]
MLEPARPWNGGPFSDAVRELLARRAAELTQFACDFGRLVDVTRRARTELVITHGEPHPANLMSVDDRLVLIDWDTARRPPAVGWTL